MSNDFTGLGYYSSRDIVIEITGNVTYTIEDLHVKIVATKSLSANPNTATILVYNLAQSTRESLYTSVYDSDENESLCKMSILLDDEEIYSGDIINVLHKRKAQQGEYETTFYCGDGANAVKQTKTEKYAKGSTVSDIFDDLMGDLTSVSGLTEGTIQGLKDCMSNRTLLRSVTMNGKIIENIQKLLKDCTSGDSDMDVYIDDGALHIVAPDELLDPTTDITKLLVDAPTLTEIGATATVFFDSSYKIGAGFTLSSTNSTSSYANLSQNQLSTSQVAGQGTYKITEIKHTIDNFSKEIAMTELTGLKYTS